MKVHKSWDDAGVKTITLEEIYADPHVLESLIAGSVPVKIVGLGSSLAVLTPTAERTSGPGKRFDVAKHRAWFLKTHGPNAYKSTRTTADIFDELRRERSPRGE